MAQGIKKARDRLMHTPQPGLRPADVDLVLAAIREEMNRVTKDVERRIVKSVEQIVKNIPRANEPSAGVAPRRGQAKNG